MLDFNKIISDYSKFKNSQKNYNIEKKNLHSFYMEHMIELDPCLDEYYEVRTDKDKTEKLFFDHPNVKTYLSLELAKTHFKELMNKYKVSSELDSLGKCAICVKKDEEDDKNILVIYDLDNNVNYCYKIEKYELIKYISYALELTNRLISEINIFEIPVLQVIYNDILNDNELSKLDNKSICKIIERELNKARSFDSSYILVTEKNRLPLNIDEKYKELLASIDSVSKEEYLVQLYIYRILSEQNIEKLYEDADDEHKEYIIKAYISLSSFNSEYHIRTTSRKINDIVLKRTKKSDDK